MLTTYYDANRATRFWIVLRRFCEAMGSMVPSTSTGGRPQMLLVLGRYPMAAPPSNVLEDLFEMHEPLDASQMGPYKKCALRNARHVDVVYLHIT